MGIYLRGNGTDYATSIKQTSDGGYIATGYTESFGAGNSDVWLLKLDGSGNVIWQKTYGGTGRDYTFDAQQTEDGGYLVTGMTNSFSAGDLDVWLLKLDGTGNVTWEKTYGGIGDDSAASVRQTLDGGYIVVGGTSFLGPATAMSGSSSSMAPGISPGKRPSGEQDMITPSPSTRPWIRAILLQDIPALSVSLTVGCGSLKSMRMVLFLGTRPSEERGTITPSQSHRPRMEGISWQERPPPSVQAIMTSGL